MGDYTQQTWTDDDGSGTVGTPFTKARMDTIENGIHDATKQASMDQGSALDGTNATTNDKKRIVWRRTSDGSYAASVESYEAGGAGANLAILQSRSRRALASGDQIRNMIEAYGTGAANPGRAAVVANYARGAGNGGASVWVEVKKDSSAADPTFTPIIKDDSGYSDFTGKDTPLNSSLPSATTGGPGGGSVVDGQECYYLAASAAGDMGVVATSAVWHFRWRSSVSRWVLVGGNPLIAQVDGNQSRTAGAGLGQLATAGPGLSAPLAGDYLVTYGATAQINAPTAAGAQALCRLLVGGTAVSSGVTDMILQAQVAGTGIMEATMTKQRMMTLTAGQQVEMQYQATNVQGLWAYRNLSLVPLSVTG